MIPKVKLFNAEVLSGFRRQLNKRVRNFSMFYYLAKTSMLCVIKSLKHQPDRLPFSTYWILQSYSLCSLTFMLYIILLQFLFILFLLNNVGPDYLGNFSNRIIITYYILRPLTFYFCA